MVLEKGQLQCGVTAGFALCPCAEGQQDRDAGAFPVLMGSWGPAPSAEENKAAEKIKPRAVSQRAAKQRACAW